ncbi:hypothetical protein [Sphaerothrix gracilis]|uniref:hypothetical protein n=1 Tax=Sphaerothrix gracilis TaxID=3151835 RepID=UPI0031FCE486
MTQATAESYTALQGFVYISRTTLDQSSLDQLMRRCITGRAWHCLRWPDRTRFNSDLPSDFVCTEGQVFNQDREFRWKQRGDRYEVLLLSSTAVTDATLKPLVQEQEWLIRDLNAHFYPETETKLPRGIHYPEDLDIGQRYFIDGQTGSVQFVALRGVKRGK